MVISSHFIVGAAVGRLTGNPILAVIFGFFAHFILDLVPHWNYGYKHLKKIKTLLFVLMDPLLIFIVFVGIGLLRGFDTATWINTFLGGVACVLYDLIEFTIRIFKIKSLTPFLYLHRHIHWFDPHPDNVWATSEDEFQHTKKGIFWGLIYQIPFVILSIYLLLT